LGAAGFVHAVGVVLKMHARIADEHLRRGVHEEPRHRCIGQGPSLDLGFVPAQISPEGAVEAQHGARSQAALPETLAVFQAG